MNFKIQKPLWSGRHVGLADSKIEKHNTIEIMYKNQHGERIYPKTYHATDEELRKYPVKNFGKNIPPLRVVPIDELKEDSWEKLNQL